MRTQRSSTSFIATVSQIDVLQQHVTAWPALATSESDRDLRIGASPDVSVSHVADLHT